MLRTTVFPTNGDEEIEFESNFLSFIAYDTYGKPAIIAPGVDHHQGPTTVLYINPANIVAVKCERVES